MTKDFDLRAAAVTLYGEGLSDKAYISHLAVDLEASESGVHKWWYKQRKVPGPAKAAIELMLKAETEEGPLPSGKRKWPDGTPMPDHVFENEPDDAIVEKFAKMPADKRAKMEDIVDRVLEGDDDALNELVI